MLASTSSRSTPAARIAGVLVAGLSLAAASAGAAGRPPAQDSPWLGPLTLEVDATDVDHRVLQVHETLPVAPGPLVLLYPE